MKYRFLLWVFVVALIGQSYAGMTKKTKSEVKFKGFGTYTTVSNEKVEGNLKKSDDENNFKGEGLMGKMVGKMFLKSGDSQEIVNLPEMKIYKIDPRKKEYTITPIQKLDMGQSESSGEETENDNSQESSEEQKSNVKVIRSEFKVTDTGEKKTINNFLSTKYTVLWLTETENTDTKERTIDSLFTTVWTTPMTSDLQEAEQSEMQFSQSYMKALGLDLTGTQQEILGTHWMSLFTQMNKQSQGPDYSDSKYATEMQKIKGYPVLIDGHFYVINPNQPSEKGGEEESSSEPTSMGGLFGKFAKKAMKKESKAPEGPVPALSYSTELLQVAQANIDDSEFTVPANYKLKK